MYAASRLGRTVHRPPKAYQLPPTVRGAAVDAKMVSAVHRAGAQLHIWTIDQQAEMHRLLDLGVDGIVTDRPDRLNEVIEERAHAQG